MITPNSAQLHETSIWDILRGVHVAFPGKVESYDATARTADIRPGLTRVTYDGLGEQLIEELPVIPAVRVARFRCGAYRIDAPLAKGDGVLVVCCDRDPAAWFASGEPVDPGDDRVHGLQGAIAIPGLYTDEEEVADLNHMVLGHPSAEIHIDATGVRLGSDSAVDYVALASKVDAAFLALKNLISGAAVFAGDGGATFKSNLLAAWSIPAVAATKVKAI